MGRRVDGGLDVHRADAEAHGAGVEAVEVHQALKRRLQRSDVIEAELVGIWRRPERGRERTGREKMRRAEHHDAQRACLVDDAMGEVVLDFDRTEIRDAQRRRTDGFPELP